MGKGKYEFMISCIYQSFEKNLPIEVTEAIKKTIERELCVRDRIHIFFRADDIGVASKNYSKMMELFLKYQTPLCLAVVPAWITGKRWEAMDDFINKGAGLFCWHIHGYRHMNHETRGKKQEFGPARSSLEIYNDLSRGLDRVQTIMGEKVNLIFTPPWNRCSLDTMEILQKLGFDGISRSFGARPLPQDGFRDFPIHADLHTLKGKQPGKVWEKLVGQLATGIKSGACGIMIHHMRMNQQAFVFLEYLLKTFAEYRQVEIITYKDLT